MMQPAPSSLISAISACLTAMGDERDVADVAGLTALAFRLQVDPEVTPASVSMFPWTADLPSAFARLGYPLQCFLADDTDPLFLHTHTQAMSAVASALEVGRPSLAWEIVLPEFGVISKIHEDTLTVASVLDGTGAPDTMPTERLGRGETPVLFVAVPGEATSVDPRDATRGALLAAIRQLGGHGARLGAMIAGVDAYRAWSATVAAGRVSPMGHAYLAKTTADLRASIGPFLDRAARQLSDESGEPLGIAARAFGRSAAALLEISDSWPFPPNPGAALTGRARKDHAALLSNAHTAEKEALAALDNALRVDRNAERRRTVRIVKARTEDATKFFRCISDLPIGGLDKEVEALQTAIPTMSAQMALANEKPVGHVYYTELDATRAGIVVPEGRFLYVFCAWVAHELRGSEIGKRLFAALIEEAGLEKFDGIFVEATTQPHFLHHQMYEAVGFEEVDRLEDDVRLLYLGLAKKKLRAKFVRSERPADGKLPVVINGGRPCPLLLRTARNMERAAASSAVTLAKDDGSAHGIHVGGRRLPLSLLPLDVAKAALDESAQVWRDLKN